MKSILLQKQKFKKASALLETIEFISETNKKKKEMTTV